jgi:putative thioredoxin
MTSDHVIDVSEASFEFEVINYSQNIPVVVDFWASWCKPCKDLEPILLKLTAEGSGSFRLARLNVDDNPNVTIRFGVRSIPTVKAFVNGQVVGEMAGLQPEGRIREFLGKIMPPSPVTLALEKGASLLAQQDWREAEKHYRTILDQHLEQTAAMFGLARALLGQAQVEEARILLLDFPASPQYQLAESLKVYADTLLDLKNNRLPLETDLDATFQNCILLARNANFPASLDGLLEIIRQDRHYRNDRARLFFLSLLTLLGEDNPLSRQYRAELASALF